MDMQDTSDQKDRFPFNLLPNELKQMILDELNIEDLANLSLAGEIDLLRTREQIEQSLENTNIFPTLLDYAERIGRTHDSTGKRIHVSRSAYRAFMNHAYHPNINNRMREQYCKALLPRANDEQLDEFIGMSILFTDKDTQHAGEFTLSDHYLQHHFENILPRAKDQHVGKMMPYISGMIFPHNTECLSCVLRNFKKRNFSQDTLRKLIVCVEASADNPPVNAYHEEHEQALTQCLNSTIKLAKNDQNSINCLIGAAHKALQSSSTTAQIFINTLPYADQENTREIIRNSTNLSSLDQEKVLNEALKRFTKSTEKNIVTAAIRASRTLDNDARARVLQKLSTHSTIKNTDHILREASRSFRTPITNEKIRWGVLKAVTINTSDRSVLQDIKREAQTFQEQNP